MLSAIEQLDDGIVSVIEQEADALASGIAMAMEEIVSTNVQEMEEIVSALEQAEEEVFPAICKLVPDADICNKTDTPASKRGGNQMERQEAPVIQKRHPGAAWEVEEKRFGHGQLC